MSKQVKAICTIIAGTIGVGFLALPYAVYQFGTSWGISVLILAGALTIVTNLAYGDIITSDKGNRQISGYAKKYLGDVAGHSVTLVIMIGLLGILLAYALLAGEALHVIMSLLKWNVTASFLSLIFVVCGLFVMRYGMQIIAKTSTFIVIILITIIFLLTLLFVPSISFENVSPLHFKSFSLIFGVSIFALYSSSSLPVIDELIGYDRRTYRMVSAIAVGITLFVYIIFSLVFSLCFGGTLSSSLVDAFENPLVSTIFALITLLAIFSSFVIIANNVKEILHYDYHMPLRTSTLLVSAILIWLVILQIGSFEGILSNVGSFSLSVQSLVVFIIWFKLFKKASLLYKVVVAVSGAVLLIGMLL